MEDRFRPEVQDLVKAAQSAQKAGRSRLAASAKAFRTRVTDLLMERVKQVGSATLFRPEAVAQARESMSSKSAYQRLVHAGNVTLVREGKPRFALVVPEHFDAADETHRRHLAAVLELAAALTPEYVFDVHSDGKGIGEIVRDVRPVQRETWQRHAFALCLLSRRLCREVAAHLPARLVGLDPCMGLGNKWRIAFQRVDLIAAETGATALPDHLGPVLAYCDPYCETVARFADLIGQVAAAASDVTLAVSPLLSGDARLVLEKLRTASPQLRFVSPERVPALLDGRWGTVLSTDPAFLGICRDVFVTRPTGEQFFLVDDRAGLVPYDDLRLTRGDAYLYKGEDANPYCLLQHLLAPESISALEIERPRAYDHPLISIVTPVYDRTDEIVRLAESIVAQDYPYLEVCFVLNGSPPATVAACRQAVQLLSNKRIATHLHEFRDAFGSATIPRDVGCWSAHGEFVCVVDSDDWLSPGFFTQLTRQPLREDHLYYPKKMFRNHGRVMPPGFQWETPLPGLGRVHALFAELIARKNFLCNSGVLFSRKLFTQTGGLLHDMSYGEDYYLWLQLGLRGVAAIEHEGVVNISLHPKNNEIAVGDERKLEQAAWRAQETGHRGWL
jgi:hypothetical protein